LTSEKKSNEKNSWYTPQLRANGAVDEALVAAIKETLHI
jgi:hypothetical protein